MVSFWGGVPLLQQSNRSVCGTVYNLKKLEPFLSIYSVVLFHQGFFVDVLTTLRFQRVFSSLIITNSKKLLQIKLNYSRFISTK